MATAVEDDLAGEPAREAVLESDGVAFVLLRVPGLADLLGTLDDVPARRERQSWRETAGSARCVCASCLAT